MICFVNISPPKEEGRLRACKPPPPTFEAPNRRKRCEHQLRVCASVFSMQCPPDSTLA